MSSLLGDSSTPGLSPGDLDDFISTCTDVAIHSSVIDSPQSLMSLETTSPNEAAFHDIDNLSDLGTLVKIEDNRDFFVTSPDVESIRQDDLTTMLEISNPAKSPQNGRKRGRPPKPKPENHATENGNGNGKVATKNRSKTGCATCRTRKKKCDETKPKCIGCQKNNVHCVYKPVEHWKSGPEKQAEKIRNRWKQSGPLPLPPIVPVVEDELDRHIFDHFSQLAQLLSIRPDLTNPFIDRLLPMALNDKGLMHSLLALGVSHLLQFTPHDQALIKKKQYHYSESVARLTSNENIATDESSIAQIIVLCLQTVIEGNTNGAHYRHMNALQERLRVNEPDETDFKKFVHEFLIYHDMSCTMTSTRAPLVLTSSFKLPIFLQSEASVFLGVCDGLLQPLQLTRELRDRVRKRRDKKESPFVDGDIIQAGSQIDAMLRSAEVNKPSGDEEWLAWQLYRVTFWLYLQRTLNQSIPTPELESGVEAAISYIRDIPEASSLQSVLLAPLFIVSCAAFKQEHRVTLSKAFDVLQRFSNLGNIAPTRAVVQNVWDLMDEGDDMSWDWEGVMEEMGMDYMVT